MGSVSEKPQTVQRPFLKLCEALDVMCEASSQYLQSFQWKLPSKLQLLAGFALWEPANWA